MNRSKILVEEIERLSKTKSTPLPISDEKKDESIVSALEAPSSGKIIQDPCYDPITGFIPIDAFKKAFPNDEIDEDAIISAPIYDIMNDPDLIKNEKKEELTQEDIDNIYKEKFRELDDITVWIVDGAYIRAKVDEEFNTRGQHYSFSFIPKDEMWIDRESNTDEHKYFIDYMLAQRHFMDKGDSFDDASDKAEKYEKSERRKSGDIEKVAPKGEVDYDKIHKRLWKKLENGVSVWIVDGKLVRDTLDIWFVAGGHDKVYEFIPKDEVWIDDAVADTPDAMFILFHELHERNLMMKGEAYDPAHKDSSEKEHYLRNHTDDLHDALAKEGWE